MFGYSGTVLRVDLSRGHDPALPPRRSTWRGPTWAGEASTSSACGTSCPRIRRACRPQNVLVFGAGPLVGTLFPGGARFQRQRHVASDRHPGRRQRGRLFRAGAALCRLRPVDHPGAGGASRVPVDPRRPGGAARRARPVGPATCGRPARPSARRWATPTCRWPPSARRAENGVLFTGVFVQPEPPRGAHGHGRGDGLQEPQGGGRARHGDDPPGGHAPLPGDHRPAGPAPSTRTPSTTSAAAWAPPS